MSRISNTELQQQLDETEEALELQRNKAEIYFKENQRLKSELQETEKFRSAATMNITQQLNGIIETMALLDYKGGTNNGN